ncbi:hypothetical protein GALL_27390 [mine drainage metagenome]|uniref:Cysteine rich repeat protein n=1 Tax=mine drainage metagenome TaxID=410659 RepID=A0A1J5TXZ7_9ZZZZ
MSMTTRAMLAGAIFFATSFSGAAVADTAPSADIQAVNTACRVDAEMAGCGQEVVGKGMLKCMGSYKKSHQDFKFSPACRSALKQMKAELSADAQDVNSACRADAEVTGCGQEVVGGGLLKCMGSYKRAHREFRFSEGCRDAMKQMKQDRNAGR